MVVCFYNAQHTAHGGSYTLLQSRWDGASPGREHRKEARHDTETLVVEKCGRLRDALRSLERVR